MRITRLGLHDFRNYTHREFGFDGALTVFVGANATGKTNVVEALQMVATGESFRNPRWEDTVRWGAETARVAMMAEGEAGTFEVEATISTDGRRVWRLDGVTRRRTHNGFHNVPVVVFTPDDLTLVKGPADQRRSAIDTLGDQLSASYRSLRREYARVVRQRNTLLRDDAPATHLAPWDEQMALLGARLHIHRRRLLDRLAKAAAPVYAHIAGGETLSIEMDDRCGVGVRCLDHELDADDLSALIRGESERRRDEERTRKASLVGPHRDDIVFMVGGRNARAFASQGQQRSVALAWKWAEVTVVSDVRGAAPILILDDVMSELDGERRRALTELVRRDIQTFITTTNTGYFEPDLLDAAQVVTIGADG